MTATTRRILLVLLLSVVSTIVPLTNAHPNYYLRTSNEDYPSTKTNKTRRMIAVGSLGDDLAKVFHSGVRVRISWVQEGRRLSTFCTHSHYIDHDDGLRLRPLVLQKR
jgi:hypothetical protein